ncbi:mucin-17-like [Discoglossus pictus]
MSGSEWVGKLLTHDLGLCIDGNFTNVKKEDPQSEQNRCMEIIPLEFQKYYTAKVTENGLVCVSDCDKLSDNQRNCNKGSCNIVTGKGPHCFCPNTDIYIYTSSDCRGQISKASVYGGVGASIAVLSISIVAMVFMMYRAKRNKTRASFSEYQEQRWYEDTDDVWSIGPSLIIQNENANYREDGPSSSSYSSSKESFRPSLENVDTNIQVKIQRPEVTTR